MTTPEGVIQAHIIQTLRMKGIFCFPVKNGGTFDAKINRFRKPHPTFMKGVSDILGIYNHRFLAIEVKSLTGTLRPEQKVFLQTVLENGGIAMMARSPEEVLEKLERWKVIA